MDPAGNNYDPATNTMTVRTVDSCLASPEANSSTHAHTAQLVIENVEDLVGWQARLNYNGGEMRPANFDFDPFTDTMTGQEISFLNLPKDGATGKHREIGLPGVSIPPGGQGPQTALVGAAYNRTQTFAVSADTPAKSPPDDSSYSAPNGGVLAALDLEVQGDQSGRTLFMQLDNNNPNAPGSKAVVFNAAGATTIALESDQLGSGFHAEGADTCSPVPTPTDAPTPSPRSDSADVSITQLSVAVPEQVHASETFNLNLSLTVENKGPRNVYLVSSVGFSYIEDCLGPPSLVNADWGLVEAPGSAQRDFSLQIVCGGSPSGSRHLTFTLYVWAWGSAYDPDTANNEARRPITIEVLGNSTLPSPTSPPIPILEPDPLRPNDDPSVVASPSSGGSPGSGVDVVQASVQTAGTAVLPAALPRTGGSGDDGIQEWTLGLVAATMAVGASLTVAFAMTRLILTQRR